MAIIGWCTINPWQRTAIIIRYGDLLCLEKDTSTWKVIDKGTTASCSQPTIKEPEERLQGRPSSNPTTELSNPGVGRAPVYWQVIKNGSSPVEALGKQPPEASRMKHD